MPRRAGALDKGFHLLVALIDRFERRERREKLVEAMASPGPSRLETGILVPLLGKLDPSCPAKQPTSRPPRLL